MLTVAGVWPLQERVYSILCHSCKVPARRYVVDISKALSNFESTCFLTNDDYQRGGIGSMRVSVELEMLREPCIQSRRDVDRQC